MSLKDNLRKQRNIAGMSQEVLAEKMSVSRQTISKWENGETYPSTKHILMLAEILGCGVEMLVSGREDCAKECVMEGGESCSKRFFIWLTGTLTIVALMVLGLVGLISYRLSADSAKVAGFDKMITGSLGDAMGDFEQNGYTTHEIVGFGITDENVFYIKCSLSGDFSEPCSALVYFCEDGNAYKCQYLEDPEFVPKGKYYKVG